MSYKIFKISGAPDEEIEDIRALLEEHSVSYYETPHGEFMSGTAALWVETEEEHIKARGLIDAYEQDRMARIRAEQGMRSRAAVSMGSGTRFLVILGVFLIVYWLFSHYL